MNKYIMVTGGAGFIGSKLVKNLRRRHRVIVLDNFLPQVHGVRPIGGEDVIVFDLRKDSFDVLKSYGQPEAIFHLAAETGTSQSMYSLENYYGSNVVGTARLLEYAIQNKETLEKFIFASSRSVYGEGEYLCNSCGNSFLGTRDYNQLEQGDYGVYCVECFEKAAAIATSEQCELKPLSHYANSKVSAERMIALALESAGIDYCNFRFQNVVGVGQSLQNPYTGVLGIFASLALSGKQINVFENGEIGRDFVHVNDVVTILEMALRVEDLPPILNLGSGKVTRLLELAEAMRDHYGSESIISCVNSFRYGDIAQNFSDNTKLFEYFPGFQFIDMSAVLPEYLDWVRANGGVDLKKFEMSLDELRRQELLKE